MSDVLSPDRAFMLQDGGRVPALPGLGGGGNHDAAGAATVRSGGSVRSRVPLSARSAASAISMHVNSYSYLSNRVYDYLHARSVWLRRIQHEHAVGGDEWEDAALKRLPKDFEPFFTIDRRTRRLDDDTISVSTTQDGIGPRVTGLTFRLLFTLFSSRHWDRLYLLLALSWAVLCPAYMDGAIAVERTQLASLLLLMFATAGAPALLALALKVFFSIRLRSRLLHDDRRRFVGVFFILATKVVAVPALCGGGRLCERRIHALTTDDLDSDDHGANALEDASARKPKAGYEGEERGLQRAPSTGDGGSGTGSNRPTTPHGRTGEDRRAGEGKRGGSTNRMTDGPKNKAELDLPPRHWMCTVCKKVNMLPDDWAGRAGKVVQVVIKRKDVDRQAMYGAFRTKPGVPVCRKCQTPFNYSWRNGGSSNQSPQQQRQRQLLEAALSRPATAASSAPSAAAPGIDTDVGEEGEEEGDPGTTRRSCFAGFLDILTRAIGFAHALVSPSRRRRDKNKLIDAGGGGGGPGGSNTGAHPELWYGREFRRQLTTYFKPELERPSLSSPQVQAGTGRAGDGGRYPVGARVACFAGKEAWYPGAVMASRENNTYDVRFDNGDIAQHVFPHMIRFEPIHRDSRLLCCYYGLALAVAVAWPLAGFTYLSSTTTTANAAAIVALPALVAGVAGALAVAVQFLEIYAENKSAGFGVTAKFAVIFALPSLSLAVVGGLAVSKALNPASAGSWVEMLLLPSIVFSLTGGGYAHAVSPAYGKAWTAASLPWLLFLLLVTLRLDGERGDARPGFGRMKWLGVYFPLWIFLLMLIAAHHALPYVWDIGVFRPPPTAQEEAGDGEEKEKGRVRVCLSRVLGELTGALRAPLAAREARRGEMVAPAAGDAAAAAAAAAADAADTADFVVGADVDAGTAADVEDGVGNVEDLETGDVKADPPNAASSSGERGDGER